MTLYFFFQLNTYVFIWQKSSWYTGTIVFGWSKLALPLASNFPYKVKWNFRSELGTNETRDQMHIKINKRSNTINRMHLVLVNHSHGLSRSSQWIIYNFVMIEWMKQLWLIDFCRITETKYRRIVNHTI